MVNGVTSKSLIARLERATKRKNEGPPYIDIDGQVTAHIKTLRAECREIRRRKPPEHILVIPEVPHTQQLQTRCFSEWNRLVHRVEFLKVANLDWVISYEAFEADVGLPPTPKSKLVKAARFIKYTGSTCTWEG